MKRVGLVVVGGAALLLIYRTLRKRLDAAESELATVSKAKDALAALARAQLDEKESALATASNICVNQGSADAKGQMGNNSKYGVSKIEGMTKAFHDMLQCMREWPKVARGLYEHEGTKSYLLPDRGETAETYWRKLKGEAPTAEETELFDRLVAAFKAMNPCHCPSKSA